MEDMKQIILKYIQKNDHVTHSDLEWLFEKHNFNYRGELLQCSNQCENIIFWSGWNQEAYNIIVELMREDKIHREPASMIDVLMMGKMLALALVNGGMSLTIKQIEMSRYLNKVYYLNLRIEALLAEKQENINIASKCTANYQNDGSSNSSHQNSKELLFCKVADQRKEIDDKIDELVGLRNTISNQIDSLNDDTYKTILSLRYLSFKTMQEISDIMHYEKRTVQRKHKEALDSLSLYVTP